MGPTLALTLGRGHRMDRLLETLRAAYEARMKKKFDADEERMEAIMKAAMGQSPLGILRALKELDDDVK
jgi:two-component system NtrC family response regulator